MMQAPKAEKQQGRGVELQRSHFKLDHYNFPNRDNAAAKAEFPGGKQTHFPNADIFANPEPQLDVMDPSAAEPAPAPGPIMAGSGPGGPEVP